MCGPHRRRTACLHPSSTSTTRQRCEYIAPGMAWLDVSLLRIEWRQRTARSARSTTPRARAQHAASNLNNRDVEILCAASARVNVSVLYQPLTPPTDLGLLASPRAAGNPGRAARGSVASRK